MAGEIGEPMPSEERRRARRIEIHFHSPDARPKSPLDEQLTAVTRTLEDFGLLLDKLEKELAALPVRR